MMLAIVLPSILLLSTVSCAWPSAVNCYDNWNSCTPQTAYWTGVLFKDCADYCRQCQGTSDGTCELANSKECSGGFQCRCSGDTVELSKEWLTHSIVEPTTILSNLYLIFIVIVYTPPPMKVYSCLIIYHSTFDVFASFSILMSSPRFVALRRARMYVFHGLCHHIGGPDFCYIWNDFMIHALAHSMLSIVILFCYRYYILAAGAVSMKKMFPFLVLIWTPSLFQWVTFYFAQDPNEILMDIARDYPPYDEL